ncbi:LOW QUALITY PROTEIN: DNA polymerase [Phytophthora palmivora]|uniref:DNA polymerase n=1 Tax=Phytophthora palmivora TaxID=4796 RepID=A0A2P4XIF9_9STRA|nr:LOW QUALITY PROTEIN: DNA polymerase [Phytophthora palmivora]
MGVSRDIALRGPECEPLPSAARVLAAFTRSRTRTRQVESAPPMGPLEYQPERWRRIKVHQEGDQYLSDIIAFLKDDLERFSPKRLKKIAKVADLFALDECYTDLHGQPEADRVTPETSSDWWSRNHSEKTCSIMRMKTFREDIRGSPVLMKNCARSSTGPGYMLTWNDS